MKKIPSFFIVLSLSFILIGIIFYSFAAEEKITLTTYYPAPYGAYKELRANQMAIGSGYRNSPLADGMLIVNGTVGVGTDLSAGSGANLVIAGNAIVGRDYAGGGNAPVDGMTIQGPVEMGTTNGHASNALSIGGDNTNGGVAIGDSYVNRLVPQNGLIVEGNVGIGATNPIAVLEVLQGTTGGYSGSTPVGFFATNTDNRIALAGVSKSSYASIVLPSDSNIGVYGVGGEWGGYFIGRGYFSSNVGIGTTDPIVRLDVDGQFRVTDKVYLEKQSIDSIPAFQCTGKSDCGPTYIMCPQGMYVCGIRVQRVNDGDRDRAAPICCH